MSLITHNSNLNGRNYEHEENYHERRKQQQQRRQQIAPAEAGDATLAAHLAAVLADPPTPVALYNAIADEIASMSEAINHDAPEVIAQTLVA